MGGGEERRERGRREIGLMNEADLDFGNDGLETLGIWAETETDGTETDGTETTVDSEEQVSVEEQEVSKEERGVSVEERGVSNDGPDEYKFDSSG